MKPGLVFEEIAPKTKPGFLPIAALLVTILLVGVAGQAPPRTDTQRQVDERLRALQKESEDLARQSQTLAGELRQLEIERDRRMQESTQAEAEAAQAQQALESTTARLATLEQQREAQLPDLENQLVDIYKRGRSGYVQLLLRTTGLRDFARTTRAVAALATINERRLADHRRTLEALAMERETRERTAADLRARETAAREARAAADRAVAARSALVARIDSRRDLTAQYVGELQAAHERLQQQVLSSSGSGGNGAVPLAPFRGGLDWPVTGRVTGRFGQASGGTAVRNGVEIAAPEDTPVLAVHGGTVGYADVFTGFGNLVIVEHGANNYSLYGYLRTISIERGATVDAGAELGRVGPAPAGPPALYFEMRIDGRSVDPLQWLKAR
jgi:septal ring factor EnvC (AmiA/AmiB activator)